MHVDQRARRLDEPVAVDLIFITRDVRQDLLAEQADLLVPVLAPELEHDVRAARVLVLLDRRDAVRGRAGDRLALVEDRVRDLAFAASRPPCSIASATGRISSCSMPARSSSVSAEPWMFCTLFARYMPAISRAPSRPRSRSVAWIEATTVQPMSMSASTLPSV